jgi:hypothetical protein
MSSISTGPLRKHPKPIPRSRPRSERSRWQDREGGPGRAAERGRDRPSVFLRTRPKRSRRLPRQRRSVTCRWWTLLCLGGGRRPPGPPGWSFHAPSSKTAEGSHRPQWRASWPAAWPVSTRVSCVAVYPYRDGRFITQPGVSPRGRALLGDDGPLRRALGLATIVQRGGKHGPDETRYAGRAPGRGCPTFRRPGLACAWNPPA